MKKLLQLGLDHEVTSQNVVEAIAKCTPHIATEADRLNDLGGLLEKFLRSIPGALAVPAVMAKDPGCGRAVAFATGQVLHYLFDEEDLLPEQSFGIVGLLDDAYLAHVFAAALSRRYPHVETALAGYEPPDEPTLRVVRSLLPAGIADALDRTCDNLIQVASALFVAGVRGSCAAPELTPALRVDDAMRAMGDPVPSKNSNMVKR